MQPEKFLELLRDGTAEKVIAALQLFFKDRPAQQYPVVRQSQAGPVQAQISLPQAITELTEAVRIQSSLTYEDVMLRKQNSLDMQALCAELKASRTLAKKLQREREEEED